MAVIRAAGNRENKRRLVYEPMAHACKAPSFPPYSRQNAGAASPKSRGRSFCTGYPGYTDSNHGGNFITSAKCVKRWTQWLRQRLEAALSCGERRCQRQCVHVDTHFDDSFEITSLERPSQTESSSDHIALCIRTQLRDSSRFSLDSPVLHLAKLRLYDRI